MIRLVFAVQEPSEWSGEKVFLFFFVVGVGVFHPAFELVLVWLLHKMSGVLPLETFKFQLPSGTLSHKKCCDLLGFCSAGTSEWSGEKMFLFFFVVGVGVLDSAF